MNWPWAHLRTSESDLTRQGGHLMVKHRKTPRKRRQRMKTGDRWHERAMTQFTAHPRRWLAGCVVLLVLLTQAVYAQNAGYGGGYPGNGGGYAAGYNALIPRVIVAPGGYGGRGIRYVTAPTPTQFSQDVARSFFAAGGLRIGTTNATSVNGGQVTPRQQPTIGRLR
jgi:hypothetical protein